MKIEIGRYTVYRSIHETSDSLVSQDVFVVDENDEIVGKFCDAALPLELAELWFTNVMSYYRNESQS